MFNETTRETLTEDINLATTQGELLQNSANFLLNKLNELSTSDNELTSNEIKIIEKQLDYHKQMMLFKTDFDIKKILMRSKLKQSISWLINQMDWSSIIDTDLLDLECKLEQWLFNDSRNIIDDKLNNSDFSGEWIFDWFLNYKIIWDFEKTNNILNYFTLELLENNILVDESRIKLDNQLVYSELSIDELYKYIKNTIQLLLSKDLLFPDSIEIQHWNEFLEIDLLKIKNELIAEKNLILQEIEKQRLKDERENNKVYLVSLLESELNNTINSEWKDILERKFEYKWNIDDWENEWYISLLNKFVNEWYIDKQYILDLYGSWDISKIILLNYLEQDKNFNYLEFIENYWLTNRIQEIWLRYVENILKLNEVDKSAIIDNLEIFVMIFLKIESSGLNISNKNDSWAEWYFQFKTNNGKEQDDWELKWGSVRTALNRIKNRIPDNENKDIIMSLNEFNMRFWKINKQKERIQDPKNLSAENQTIMFLGDLFWEWRYVKNVGVDINQDKMISANELYNRINEWIDLNKDGEYSKNELLNKRYNWIDVNNDGVISNNETLYTERRPLFYYLKDIFLNNKEWSLTRVYEVIHHWDVDQKTIDVFRKIKNDHYRGNKKYIAKNHY